MPRRTVLLAALAVLVGAGQALAQKPTKKDSQQERVRGYYLGPRAAAKEWQQSNTTMQTFAHKVHN